MLTLAGSVRYELVTAFEVFEHLAEPAKTVAQLLSISDSILFSTEPLPIPAPPIADWWYYGPEHGQHIAFFTRVALQSLPRVSTQITTRTAVLSI